MGATKKMLPFSWYGGKFNHLDWLLPKIGVSSSNFVDVFGGSMSVLLNRKKSLSDLETYNDIDSELVNFFQVLRRDPEKLQQQLSLTPYARQEFILALQLDPDLPDLERARRFFIRIRMSRSGLGQKTSAGRWAYTCQDRPTCPDRYWGSIDGLFEIAKRIQRVQIECESWQKIIERYDREDAFFYLDPPYHHASRKTKHDYGNEMSHGDHAELARTCKSMKGKFALSGYRCKEMDELFGGFIRHDAPASYRNLSHAKRQESLWCNYEIENDLFGGM